MNERKGKTSLRFSARALVSVIFAMLSTIVSGGAVLGDGAGERGQFRGEIDRVVRSAASATTSISAGYLVHAAHGDFAEPLARLANAIACGAPAGAVGRVARQALAVGATSGGDGVRGLVLGLGAWRWPPRMRVSTRRG